MDCRDDLEYEVRLSKINHTCQLSFAELTSKFHLLRTTLSQKQNTDILPVTVQSGLMMDRKKARTACCPWIGLRVTGYLQVTLGLCSVLVGVVAIVFKSFMYAIGYPVWAGICFYIVAGILGIAAGGKQHKGLVIAYLVISIFASLAAAGMLIAHCIAILFDGRICPDESGDLPYEFYSRVGCSSSFSTRATINGFIIGIGLIEGIVAVVGASMTCGALCCSGTSGHMVQYQGEVVVVGQPTAVVVPQQQFMQQPQQQIVQQPEKGGQLA